MDREFVLEELKDKLSERMKEIHQANSKVTLICHARDEVRCVELLQAAGLDATTIKHEDERLLPKGKSVVVINIDGVDIVNQTDKLATEIANLCEIQEIQTPSPQGLIDEIEELMKEKERVDFIPAEVIEEKMFQKEQMKLRSRYMSKNCRKL
jgi:hypothetical protein